MFLNLVESSLLGSPNHTNVCNKNNNIINITSFKDIINELIIPSKLKHEHVMKGHREEQPREDKEEQMDVHQNSHPRKAQDRIGVVAVIDSHSINK